MHCSLSYSSSFFLLLLSPLFFISIIEHTLAASFCYCSPSSSSSSSTAVASASASLGPSVLKPSPSPSPNPSKQKSLNLILQFDGSLRQPKDPYQYHNGNENGNNYPCYVTRGNSSSSNKLSSNLAPIATCSSVLFHSENEDEDEDGNEIDNELQTQSSIQRKRGHNIVWIGGREIVSSSENDTSENSTDNNVRNHSDHDYHQGKQEQQQVATTKIMSVDGGDGGGSGSLRITSAVVEYEALLLGLHGLMEYLDTISDVSLVEEGEEKDHAHQQKQTHVPTKPNTIFVVTVQGDCKTVIDQMNGTSTPRKQRPYHTIAKNLIRTIQQKWNSYNHKSKDRRDSDDIYKYSNKNEIHFVYEHVPRDQNILCDYLCRKVVQLVQYRNILDMKRSIDDVANEIETEIHSEIHTETETVMSNRMTMTHSSLFTSSLPSSSLLKFWSSRLPSSKKKRFKFVKTKFASVIYTLMTNWDNRNQNRGCGNNSNRYPIVPLSIRPFLLCEVLYSAVRVGDIVAVRLVGEALVEESKWWKSNMMAVAKVQPIAEAEEEIKVGSVSSPEYVYEANGSQRVPCQGDLHNLCKIMEMNGYQLILYSLEQMELYKEAKKMRMSLYPSYQKLDSHGIDDSDSSCSNRSNDNIQKIIERLKDLQRDVPNAKYNLHGVEDFEYENEIIQWKRPLEDWYDSFFKQIVADQKNYI